MADKIRSYVDKDISGRLCVIFARVTSGKLQTGTLARHPWGRRAGYGWTTTTEQWPIDHLRWFRSAATPKFYLTFTGWDSETAEELFERILRLGESSSIIHNVMPE